MSVLRIKSIPILLLACTLVLLPGCSSHKAADGLSPNSKSIVDITINENSEALILIIKGSQILSYTSEKQNNSKRILFYFPDTTLGNVRGHFIAPENEVISSIRTAEIVENNATSSSILINLKKDATHDLIPNQNELQVVFPKISAQSNSIQPQQKSENQEPVLQSADHGRSAASRLLKVTAEPLDDLLKVFVEADGPIVDYKSFAIDEPVRIVFDLYNIKSPYAREHKISFQSKWVKQIRYFGHPDKVRLVLDTHHGPLPKYASYQTDTGLLIQVGQIPANTE